MNSDISWFEEFKKTPGFAFLKKRPVAYFCAEFALSVNIPIYAGGLGVLAGDMVKEAADRDFPLVTVGLYYHEGYVCQVLDENGNIVESCKVTKPEDAQLTPVVDQTQTRVTVTVPIQDRVVYVQAWKWERGNIPIFLLDTDMPQNNPSDRKITNRLYDLDKETRFKQEMILGIGGVRLLEALSIHPSIYHMNEGHSAMLVLDLIRHEMYERKMSFTEAKALTSPHIVFTNHTLIPAGDELFSNDLASAILSAYAKELAVPNPDIVALGLVQESSIFSMTMLSLRLAARINAVSKLHQKKAKEIWTDHPMDVVTNGIHIPSWDKMQSHDTIWENHQENKRKLLLRIKKVTGVTFGEDELLLGWARRMVAYKRPFALFEKLSRFSSITRQASRPVRVVVAGQAPPGDTNGAELLQKLESLISNDLKGTAVYLPNYDLDLAQLLVSGADVWLNTPVVGFEASGTSGMKAALNGVLPATTRDGWVSEVELFGIGWVLDSDRIHEHVLDVLEYDIVPMYYTRDGSGVPMQWVSHMRNARDLIQNQFSATRMLREYIEKMYVAAMATLHT